MDEIANLLGKLKLPVGNEAACQEAIADALAREGVQFVREARLGPRSRIDFLCADGVGIEVKVEGSGAAVARQLKQYELFDSVKSLILVTRRSIDPRPAGFTKPIRVVWISRNLL
jgi:hypothetical protein